MPNTRYKRHGPGGVRTKFWAIPGGDTADSQGCEDQVPMNGGDAACTELLAVSKHLGGTARHGQDERPNYSCC
jgi:hypothetical protein